MLSKSEDQKISLQSTIEELSANLSLWIVVRVMSMEQTIVMQLKRDLFLLRWPWKEDSWSCNVWLTPAMGNFYYQSTGNGQCPLGTGIGHWSMVIGRQLVNSRANRLIHHLQILDIGVLNTWVFDYENLIAIFDEALNNKGDCLDISIHHPLPVQCEHFLTKFPNFPPSPHHYTKAN